MSRRIVVIVNPHAGNGRAARRWPRMAQTLRHEIGDFDEFMTLGPGHATELAREALQGGCDRIVSVGGDGTHNEVVNGFLTEGRAINGEARLAIIALGTGSDLARTLAVPRGARSLSYVAGDDFVAADVGRARFRALDGAACERYFINVADFGCGGAVAARVNRASKALGGFATFLWGLTATLLTFRNPHLRLTVGDAEFEGRFNNVIVANAQYYGGGMRVAPGARLDSGVFEVYVIGDAGRIEAFANLPRLYRGNLRRSRKVCYSQAQKVQAASGHEVLLNLDGEPCGKLPVEIDILSGAVKLVRA